MNARKKRDSTRYDRICFEEFFTMFCGLADDFAYVSTECPYNLPCLATFYQARLSRLSDHEMELFFAAGFRRNGDWLYSMACENCNSCIPIRLQSSAFQPNRNQRRTFRKNGDVTVTIKTLTPTKEHMQLCDRFLQQRYPSGESSASSYYSAFFLNHITHSAQVEYRVDGELMGAAIIDVGECWMNAVYFYFDPAFSARSPGTFNILYLLKLCQIHGIEYLYLGYLIEELPAMNYKKRFHPYQILVGNSWQTVDKF